MLQSRNRGDSMESSAQQHYDPQQLQSQQPSLGLLRFRSAPSSLFGNFMDGGTDKARSESEILVPRFMNSGSDKSRSPASPTVASSQSTFSGLPPHYPRQGAALSSSAMDTDSSSYDFLPIDHQGHRKPIGSNLSRQSSSPAGLFGYSNMKVVGNYGGLNGGSGDVSPLSNTTKNPITFSSRLPSSLGMLSQIPESEAEAIGGAAPDDDGKLKCGNFDPQFYNSSLSYGSWNGSPHLMDSFSGMKRERDSDHNGCVGDSVPRLSHHLSLPKTSSEMAAVEKFLQFQDSVPCKIRAKRGCATHPRSIAERVRRTRISERMRKLQDLVPNMDKQTNTADMLDLAVDYIKDLQRQFKLLSDSQAKCRCSDVQKPVDSPFV